MKKHILYFSFIFSLIFCSSFGQSKMMGNKKFPIEKLHFYKSKENLKIVVFMPSIYINGYEQMLTKSLKYYFQEGLAFNSTTKPVIDVILIVNENKGEGLFYDFKRDTESMLVYFDEKGLVFNSFGIKKVENLISIPNDGDYSKNSDKVISSKVFLLDEKNNILLKDDDYRAQGEHLKILENKIKKHLNMDVTNQAVKSKNFAVGDKASMIIKEIPERLKYASSLKVLKENNWDILKDDSFIKVITFYPAAFSGNDNTLKENRLKGPLRLSIKSTVNPPKKERHMTCAYQITQLDESSLEELITSISVILGESIVPSIFATSLEESIIFPATSLGESIIPFPSISPAISFGESITPFPSISSTTSFDYSIIPSTYPKKRRNKSVKKYAISSSSKQILEKWNRSLGTRNIIYINDEDYSISKEFGAYNNSKGYNNRVTYIIGKDGMVKYIDYDYTYKDNEVLNKIIDSLLK